MRIGSKAAWAQHKRFDKDREIAVAVDGKGNKQIYVKCHAKDFSERNTLVK